MRLRQFWTAKALWGNLSASNRLLNNVGDIPFSYLNGKTYLEVGTGVDNILRVLRVDFIWKLLPEKGYDRNPLRFGVFGSFRFSF